jgi:hypothetical protein
MKELSVRAFHASDASEWKSFLATSNNGTLFHDLDFLAYHPSGRFHEHHCLVREGNQLLAVMPAAVVTTPQGRRYLSSPYGGSIGGPVVQPGLRLTAALALIRALQVYTRDLGLSGLELRLAPGMYDRQPSEVLPFSLMANGFYLHGRSLLFMVPTTRAGGEPLTDRLLSSSKRYDVRAGLKRGLQPREVDANRLGDFFPLFRDTYARLDATPTHQEVELEDIVRRVPGRARVFLCAYEGREIAGTFVFMLNDRIANTFYICERTEDQKLCGAAVLIAHLIERMADERIRYVDLGPSASESHVNEGVVFFKEGVGAQGFCRDTWRWDCAASESETP